MNQPSQPFLIALPCAPGTSVDLLKQLVEIAMDATSNANLVPPGATLTSRIASIYGSPDLSITLMADADFAAAAGDPTKFFANSGAIFTKPAECGEVLAAYREYLAQPNDDSRAQWLAGQGSVVQNIEDPSNAEVQIQFVAAAQAPAAGN